mmetsp:Transcript_12258/g.18742  ORF Transcript_12258/g.18742 Transcript_12258/m.18742 type:complete len:123 (-) Transcript_12258:47-415(-)
MPSQLHRAFVIFLHSRPPFQKLCCLPLYNNVAHKGESIFTKKRHHKILNAVRRAASGTTVCCGGSYLRGALAGCVGTTQVCTISELTSVGLPHLAARLSSGRNEEKKRVSECQTRRSQAERH